MRWLLTIPLAALCGAAMAWEPPQAQSYGSVCFDTDSSEVYGYDILPIDSQDTVTLVGHTDRRVDIYVKCGLSLFACTAEPPNAWGPDSEPTRMVTDRSRF